MPLIYITEPDSDALSCGILALGVVVLLIYLYVRHYGGESGKSNNEKVNPITFSLNDKNKKDE